jgi:hypothetical protein
MMSVPSKKPESSLCQNEKVEIAEVNIPTDWATATTTARVMKFFQV